MEPSPYEWSREIYSGARFSVLRARRTGGVGVIIKRAHPGRPELRSAERLRHEYEILRFLDAPGTARALDLTTFEGDAALVLEDAGARNLADRLNGRPLDVDAFLELAVPMAEMVREVHERRVIHRDICPANFVLDEPRAAVTLVDFGSATAVPAFAKVPGVPGAFEGTLPYMAPEQTGRMKRLVDRRADLYGLGATFYAMLTGQPPFTSRDPLELVHAHAAQAPHPPAVVNPKVPTVLSDIVVKLLAKMPEWRYQTAAALAADLEEARRQRRERGEIAHFELGRRDLPYGLFLQGDKLYGREEQARGLEEAVQRTASGAAELVVVAGPAGIGKSALVNEVREAALEKGLWSAGRGDQLRDNVPYAPFAEALGGLARSLLAWPEPRLKALRERVQRATAPNGRVLVDVVPDLRALLGDQPPVAEVGAVECEQRFRLVFTAFVRALLAEGPPLVLFLDDLQWFDPASLHLLRAVAADPEIRSLLILCAFRSEEVGAGHPVAQALESIQAGGARVTRLDLEPLDSDAVQALLCDALRAAPPEVARLAEVVRRKTGSNPFFVRQFLGYLYRKQLIAFDAQRARWTWDLASIGAAELTENVVEMLSSVIATLPLESQEALRAAACVGNRFGLGLLSHLLDQPRDATARALWAPIQQGLLVPAAEGPRFGWAAETPVELGTTVTPAFRFAHDRIQQAAYEGLPEETRQTLHLRAGRWLEQRVPRERLESALGAIVDQLNRAAGQVHGAERLHLARLNAQAGDQARRKGALASALGYFLAGRSLLPPEAWRGELQPLWFTLLKDAAECAGLTGDRELGESLVDEGLARTGDALERAALGTVSALTNALYGEHAQALRRGREGLAALGMDLPGEMSAQVASAETARARASLRLRSERQLLEAPPMEDPACRAALQLLINLSSSWFTSSETFQVVASRAATLAAEKGVAPGAAAAYTYYGAGLAISGDYEEGYRWGCLGARLAERRGDPAELCRALLLLGGHIGPWRAPMAESVPLLQRCHALGLESGDVVFAAYGLANLVFTRMSSGAELNQVLAEAESCLAFYRKVLYLSGIPYVRPFVQAVRCLKGLTRDPLSFDDDAFDEARFLAHGAENELGQTIFHILRVQACYLFGDPERAWRYAQDVATLPSLRSLFLQVDFRYYEALAAAALVPGAGPAERSRLTGSLRECLRALETWSVNAPMNFQHKRDLVAAEVARIEDRPVDALALYHRAIEGAGREGFTQDEALAHELCARFHRARGATRMADLHLAASIDGYARWGATAKVDQMERELPPLDLSGKARPLITSPAPPALDYSSLVRSSEALTAELVFDRLLETLVRTSGEAVEAERTALALDEGGLVLRATATARGEVSLVQQPVDASRSVPTSVLEHVFRTREVLVLGDAAREGRFTADPYISEHGVRSVLAVPIIRGAQALGVLYFENNLVSDAFTTDRAEMLRLLSAQIAIALGNSRLFEERQRSAAALRLLSEVSAQLAETLDDQEVLSRIGRLAVPSLADFCIVEVLENGVLRPVAWAHADPARAPALAEIHQRYPVEASSTQPQGQVLRSSKPLLLSRLNEEAVLAAVRDERHLRLVRTLDPRSLMVVPLVIRGRSAGTVTFGSSSPTRRYDRADLALAEEVVRRFGVALDNARLHRDLRDALRQREERDRYLDMVLRQLPGAVWAVDRDLRFTYATGHMSNVNLGAGGPVGRTVDEALSAGDPTHEVLAHHRAALRGERRSYEHRFRGRWYAVLLDPVRDQDQRVVGCVGVAIDVTGQREIAERLARSEERLREAQRVAHVGSFEWDMEPNALTWSDELQRIYGFEPGGFAGTFEAFLERVPAGEAESTRKIVFDALTSQRPFQYEHRIVRKDGRVRVLHSRGDVVRDERGRPIRMMGTCWDITEQRELIAKLEQAVSRWEATVNATAEGILVVDLENKVLSVNERFLKLWGLPPLGSARPHHRQLLIPALDQLEDPDAFLYRLEEIYAQGGQGSLDVVRFKDGRVFERSSAPQRIGEEIAGRVWSLRDVTERERLLRRATFLADATRLLASLDMEQALDGVAHLAVPLLGDGCAIDLFVDGAPRRVAAVSRDAHGTTQLEVHPAVLTGKPILYRRSSISRLGAPLLMKGHLVGAITLSAAPYRQYAAPDLDLAEELARRAALAIDNARLYRKAQEALRARDELLSIAAHEIRGPLNSIHLAVQSIRQARVPANDLPRLFDVVERQDRRLSRFVEELLELGRIRAGHLQLDVEDVNLGDVVHEVAARLGPELARSGSALTVVEHEQVVGQWDRSHLDQVVFNLLSNAMKFGLGKPIEITVGARDDSALLFVKDHGMGISPELRERIFEPFERGVSVRHYGGLGLGLHIVKSIVEALGGRVSVASEPGLGSTFEVELPQEGVRAERDAHPDSR
ncbi:MAG TPA: AAA family ATPase [Myxococcaceae bacterium]